MSGPAVGAVAVPTAAPAPSGPVLDAREAVRLGATSLVLFGQLFFPRAFRQESPDFHREIGLHLLGPARYNAFKIFRDGAKTTLLRVYTAQRIAYDLSRTILFVSVSQPHSIMSLRWLKKQVERNAPFAQAFGLRPGDKWTDEWLEVRNEITGGVSNILAAGVTGQIRGFNLDDFRPDLIVGDDLCNEENTATEEQRIKISNLWFGALLNSLAPRSEMPLAKMALLQTPLNPADLISLCSKDPAWNCITYGVFDAQGASRWPSRWSTQELQQEKAAQTRIGKYSLWMREKECKLVAGEHMPLDPENIQYYDEPPEGGITIISIDPASSDDPKANELAVVAFRVLGQKIYVLECFSATNVMPDHAAAKFFEFVWKYNPVKGVVETVAYQKILKWYLEQEMSRRRLYIPIDEIKDKRKKEDRILQALQQPLLYKNFYVRKNAEDSVKLVHQIGDFSPGAESLVDIIDALALGITSINPALRYYSGSDQTVAYVPPGTNSKPLERFRACP